MDRTQQERGRDSLRRNGKRSREEQRGKRWNTDQREEEARKKKSDCRRRRTIVEEEERL